MNTIGQVLRKLRKKSELLLREVAAGIRIDSGLLSKIERDERMPTKEQVNLLTKFYKDEENEIQIAWLSDKLVYEIGNEENALKALQVAEEKVEYKVYKRTDRRTTIKKIKDYLVKDGRVAKAWLFGSFARGDDDHKSDIDIMVEFKTDKKYSLFDFLEIQDCLENLLSRKIDLVENGYVKPFAWESVKKDLTLIV